MPGEQQRALAKAVRLEWISLAFTACTITVVAFVLGNSQAMKTAWIEDILSTVPQIAFLVALLSIRRSGAKAKRPYGMQRATTIGHLVASVALALVGGFLAYEAISGFVSGEHPTVGTVQVFGTTVWLGWLMIAVMAAIIVPPVLLGRAKMRLAPVLNDKVLYADAKMNKADWMTNAASIVGVAGIGAGWWWMDYAAALLISADIIKDGLQNTRSAVLDLIDRRATTFDSDRPHPVIARIPEAIGALPWVRHCSCRVRNMGRRLYVDLFVVPHSGQVSVEQVEQAVETCRALDWAITDVVVMPVVDPGTGPPTHP